MIMHLINFFIIIGSLQCNENLKSENTIDKPEIEKKYFGEWPVNKNINNIIGPDMTLDCPGEIGCECDNNNDCVNGNCKRIPKGGYCMPKKGDIFPEFIALDQFDEYVNIYDFAYQGKYIFVEMGATWCAPCRVLANWLAHNDDEIESKPWWKSEYNVLHEMIRNGDVYFITILYEDEFKDNATYDTLYDWYDNYPDDNILILGDSDKFLHTWIKPTGIPAITLLNENMEIVTFANRGLNYSFDKFLEIVKNEK